MSQKIVNINRKILGAWRDGHPGKPKIRELAQVLHADPTEKANILNRQFQSAFLIRSEHRNSR